MNWELIILAITALLLGCQTLLLYLALRKDHKRRREQSTIENLGPIVRNARRRIRQGEKDEKELRSILADLEHGAVGLNADIYDREVFFRMFGPSLVEVYYHLLPVIEISRQRNPKAYYELESVINEMKLHERYRDMIPAAPKILSESAGPNKAEAV